MEEKNKITKEEMNLVEYPFQYLGRIVPREVKTIQWSDVIITKEGKRVEAKWIVTGSDKYGLPRFRDRDILCCYLFEKRNGTEYVIFDFNKDYLDHNFQEELARNETYIQHLIEEIYSVVGKDNPDFIEKVARNVPPDLIFRVLGEVKELANSGELKTSRYNEFKKLVKKYMKEIYSIRI